MGRPERVRFEPVEYLVLDVGRNARAGIGDGEDDVVVGFPGAQADGGVLRRKSDGIGQEIIQHLHHAAFVAHEVADVGIDVDPEFDAVGGEPVLDALGRGFDGLADIDRAQIERHGAGVDGGEIEDVVDDGEQRIGRRCDVA